MVISSNWANLVEVSLKHMSGGFEHVMLIMMAHCPLPIFICLESPTLNISTYSFLYTNLTENCSLNYLLIWDIFIGDRDVWPNIEKNLPHIMILITC